MLRFRFAPLVAHSAFWFLAAALAVPALAQDDKSGAGEQGAKQDDKERKEGVAEYETEGGAFKFTIDTSESPELREWATKELAPVVQTWYPKIVEMLPSENFEAPKSFSIVFSPEMSGVAATGGTRIRCATSWFEKQLQGEGKGAIVHELVHVVQQYGRAPRINGRRNRAPGWLTEGIPDYIRWYLYEPESNGARITRRNLARANYDGSYRTSANFLHWIVEKNDVSVITKLNAALRDGTYTPELWEELTKSKVEDLNTQWKADLEKQLADGK